MKHIIKGNTEFFWYDNDSFVNGAPADVIVIDGMEYSLFIECPAGGMYTDSLNNEYCIDINGDFIDDYPW